MSLEGIFPIDRWDFNSDTILLDLPDKDYDLLLAHSREEKYAKGEIIFREGAKPTGIYYITKGTVKKYKVDNFEKEHIIYVASSGELIGYHAVLASENYPDSASTLEECTIRFIPANEFLSVLDQSPELTRRLLKTLSHEFGVLVNNITIFAQRPVRERVAIALIVLREKFKKEDQPGSSTVINLSRDDIAKMSGTTRENATRFLTEFKNEKIIETMGRKIIVLDVAKLVATANYE